MSNCHTALKQKCLRLNHSINNSIIINANTSSNFVIGFLKCAVDKRNIFVKVCLLLCREAIRNKKAMRIQARPNPDSISISLSKAGLLELVTS